MFAQGLHVSTDVGWIHYTPTGHENETTQAERINLVAEEYRAQRLSETEMAEQIRNHCGATDAEARDLAAWASSVA